MATETKNGKAETAETKRESTLRAVKSHVKKLKKAKEVCENIAALKRTDVTKIIDAEILKAKDLARKMIEKELNEL